MRRGCLGFCGRVPERKRSSSAIDQFSCEARGSSRLGKLGSAAHVRQRAAKSLHGLVCKRSCMREGARFLGDCTLGLSLRGFVCVSETCVHT
jgi:hypothetical protein